MKKNILFPNSDRNGGHDSSFPNWSDATISFVNETLTQGHRIVGSPCGSSCSEKKTCSECAQGLHIQNVYMYYLCSRIKYFQMQVSKNLQKLRFLKGPRPLNRIFESPCNWLILLILNKHFFQHSRYVHVVQKLTDVYGQECIFGFIPLRTMHGLDDSNLRLSGS